MNGAESIISGLDTENTNHYHLHIIYAVWVGFVSNFNTILRRKGVNALVVGADRLGKIPDALAVLGIHVSRHVTGRASAHQRSLVALPKNIQLLILLTDFLNHNAMKSYRNQAQVQGIAVIACKRSSSCLVQSVRRYLGLAKTCNECAGTGIKIPAKA